MVLMATQDFPSKTLGSSWLYWDLRLRKTNTSSSNFFDPPEDILSGIYSAILSGLLSGSIWLLSDILCLYVRHSFWHLAFCLAFYLTCFLVFEMVFELTYIDLLYFLTFHRAFHWAFHLICYRTNYLASDI
jgi:hypothetical protein